MAEYSLEPMANSGVARLNLLSSSVTNRSKAEAADSRASLNSGETVQATSDDTFHIALRFVNGGRAMMTGTSAAPFGPGGGIEIFGTQFGP
jgi:hypothetical protein